MAAQPIISGLAGKFVQLYIVKGDSIIPILGTSDEPEIRCGTVLRRTLIENCIDFKMDKELVVFPAVKGEDYEAVGMGRYELKNGIFIAHGTNFSYQMDPNKQHFEELKGLYNFKYRKVK